MLKASRIPLSGQNTHVWSKSAVCTGAFGLGDFSDLGLRMLGLNFISTGGRSASPSEAGRPDRSLHDRARGPCTYSKACVPNLSSQRFIKRHPVISGCTN